MIDRLAIDRVLAANRYLVLGTADEAGQPWVSPVFFARLDPNRLCLVSSPDSRHSRNLAHRNTIAITVFDSSVAVAQAEVAYFDARAAPAIPGDGLPSGQLGDDRSERHRRRQLRTRSRRSRFPRVAAGSPRQRPRDHSGGRPASPRHGRRRHPYRALP